MKTVAHAIAALCIAVNAAIVFLLTTCLVSAIYAQTIFGHASVS
jgi:hypothetical protein